MAEHAYDVLKAARRSLRGNASASKRVQPEAEAFSASPAISIDYAVMEKSASVAVVPVDMGGSDVGSWDALGHISTRDSAATSAAEMSLHWIAKVASSGHADLLSSPSKFGI